MNQVDELTASTLLKYTTQIVVAYVGHRHTANDEIPLLVRSVHAALQSELLPELQSQELIPAVPINKSVFPDYLICLEDGKKLRMLKRHLALLGMTPDDYRRKWGLSWEYPMVARNYATLRSKMAKDNKLGHKRPGQRPGRRGGRPPASSA